LAISGGKGKAAIANHLHDHLEHVYVMQQSQQLAGEATESSDKTRLKCSTILLCLFVP